MTDDNRVTDNAGTEPMPDRVAVPADPTNADLRHDAELTRQQLAQTVAALSEKADVKARVQAAAHRGAENVRTKGDELVGKLPDPVATKVAPAWDTVSHRPMIPLAGLAALIAVLVTWLRLRKH